MPTPAVSPVHTPRSARPNDWPIGDILPPSRAGISAPPSTRVLTEADEFAWQLVAERAGIPPSPRTLRLGSLLTGLFKSDLPLTDYVVVQDDEERAALVAWDLTPDPDDPVGVTNPRSAVALVPGAHGVRRVTQASSHASSVDTS